MKATIALLALTLTTVPLLAKPLKVFILAGQSNMEGHARVETFDYIADDPATGHYYRLMVRHVNGVLADPKRVCPEYDAAQGYEIAGFAWLQGWNDLVDSGVYPNRSKPGGYDAYSEAMAHFIRDMETRRVRRRLPLSRLRENLRADGAGIRGGAAGTFQEIGRHA